MDLDEFESRFNPQGIYVLPEVDQDDVEDENDDEFDDEDDEHLLEHRSLYSQAWSACHERIQATLTSLHDASLESISNFVYRDSDAGGGAPSLLQVLSGRKLLRTGLVVGVNPASSSLLFSSLCNQLASKSLPPLPPREAEDEDAEMRPARTPCLVSRLTSRDCVNIKGALRKLIGGFLGKNSAVGDGEGDEDEDEEPEVESSPQKKKAASSTTKAKPTFLSADDIQNLSSWYSHQLSKKDAPKPHPTLVVLLEDLEAVDAKVLTKLIDVLSDASQALPLVLLIGIATSPNALSESLLLRSLNLLDTERFFVEPAIATFNTLMKGLFVDWESPLALGPKAYTYLHKTFEDMHHSIDATISSIQYLHIHHFTSKPHSRLSLLTSSSPNLDASTLLDSPTLSSLRSLPSLVSGPKSPSTNILLTSTSPEQVLKEVLHCQEERVRWQSGLREGWALFHALGEAFGRELKGERVLMMLFGEGRLADWSEEVIKLIQQTTATKLTFFLNLITTRLEKSSDSSSPLLSRFTALSDSLERALELPRGKGRQILVNIHAVGNDLMYPNASLGEGDREFSKLVLGTISAVRESLRHAFRPCTELLLHELWFCNDVIPLKRFHPSFLAASQRSLEAADQPATTPSDIAVGFRLYKETGKNVNLGDWFSTFDQTTADDEEEEVGINGKGKGKGKEVERSPLKAKGKKRVRDEEEEESEENEDEEDEEEDEDEKRIKKKMARFLSVLGDLTFTGYVVPSTRKAEHVIKTVL